MVSEIPNVVVPLSSRGQRAQALTHRPYGVEVDATELRREMQCRGLTGAELARRAKVSPATISHALNGRRIHPSKLRAIRAALNETEALPAGWNRLVRQDAQEPDR
jgi:hypothetical protein